MRIVQISDIHVGKEAFSPDLLEAVIEETNELEPDLVAVAGDLTMEGHRREFEEAKSYLDRPPMIHPHVELLPPLPPPLPPRPRSGLVSIQNLQNFLLTAAAYSTSALQERHQLTATTPFRSPLLACFYLGLFYPGPVNAP